ncbi:unnamed protein product [Dracunculus medinensis]|uniref:Copine domain-containing protein n=1 Tax=Dracunculus medinensis TaxID=318479 RepID=A0A0N4US20_DRAME|nr:unnamed protein product [Dracunculus medinensis]
MVFRNIKLRKDGQFLGLMLIESFPALGRSWDLFECSGKAFNMNQMSWLKQCQFGPRIAKYSVSCGYRPENFDSSARIKREKIEDMLNIIRKESLSCDPRSIGLIFAGPKATPEDFQISNFSGIEYSQFENVELKAHTYKLWQMDQD